MVCSVYESLIRTQWQVVSTRGLWNLTISHCMLADESPLAKSKYTPSDFVLSSLVFTDEMTRVKTESRRACDMPTLLNQ